MYYQCNFIKIHDQAQCTLSISRLIKRVPPTRAVFPVFSGKIVSTVLLQKSMHGIRRQFECKLSPLLAAGSFNELLAPNFLFTFSSQNALVSFKFRELLYAHKQQTITRAQTSAANIKFFHFSPFEAHQPVGFVFLGICQRCAQ